MAKHTYTATHGLTNPSCRQTNHRSRRSVHLRPPEAAEVVRGDGGEGHLADGGAGAVEGGGEARGPHAAAPGADGEEVVVVLPRGGGPVRRGGGRDRAAEAGAVGEPRGGGEGAEAVAVDEEGAARGEGPGQGLEGGGAGEGEGRSCRHGSLSLSLFLRGPSSRRAAAGSFPEVWGGERKGRGETIGDVWSSTNLFRFLFLYFESVLPTNSTSS